MNFGFEHRKFGILTLGKRILKRADFHSKAAFPTIVDALALVTAPASLELERLIFTRTKALCFNERRG